MSDKLKNYYKNDFLFAGHRMMMPQAGEKFKHACGQCKYYVNVIGQQENRRICLAGVKAYALARQRSSTGISQSRRPQHGLRHLRTTNLGWKTPTEFKSTVGVSLFLWLS